MHTIQFKAADLKGTQAMYMPHHASVPITEFSHGMLIEYTELRRQYMLHLPTLNEPLVAEDNPELVCVNVEPGSPERAKLVMFLNFANIKFGAMNVIDPSKNQRHNMGN